MRKVPDRKRRVNEVVAAAAAVVIAHAGGGAKANAQDVRVLTPSALLAPGSTETKVFASLYTQTEFFDDDGRRRDAGARSTYATATVSILRGVSARWNLGFEAAVRGVRDDTFPQGERSRVALASVAPRVKWAPLAAVPTCAVQFSFAIPTASRLSGTSSRPFLDFGDPVFGAQLLLDRRHWARWLTYAESGAFIRFGRADEDELDSADEDGFSTPFKWILNFEPDGDWTVYAAQELFVDWDRSGTSAWYFQSGLGAKRRFSSTFEFETLASIFPAGRAQGAGVTFGFGFRRVR